ncbi:hypothetical protein F5Y16DRAFT_412974 [Xylariaceae sp. FL0255]|nr:hypothetical protein F5Y16DRAFT_412974 [Xylariaceae sp. FL0255]
MLLVKTVVLLVGAASVPLVNAVDYWARFCDDRNCSRNCGEPVSLDDPGCLNEHNRSSIHFHGKAASSRSLSTPNCSAIPKAAECWDISQFSDDKSYRFIGSKCSGNNC